MWVEQSHRNQRGWGGEGRGTSSHFALPSPYPGILPTFHPLESWFRHYLRHLWVQHFLSLMWLPNGIIQNFFSFSKRTVHISLIINFQFKNLRQERGSDNDGGSPVWGSKVWQTYQVAVPLGLRFLLLLLIVFPPLSPVYPSSPKPTNELHHFGNNPLCTEGLYMNLEQKRTTFGFSLSNNPVKLTTTNNKNKQNSPRG